ncbi:MAG: hypothetical protein RLZZ127_877 [Planctomycetota bacterium]|jgi:capsular polysaccharide transport system permease protein
MSDTDPTPATPAPRPATRADQRARVAARLAALPPETPDEPKALAARRRRLTRRLARLTRVQDDPQAEPVAGPSRQVPAHRQATILRLRRILKRLGPAVPTEAARITARRDRTQARLQRLVQGGTSARTPRKTPPGLPTDAAPAVVAPDPVPAPSTPADPSPIPEPVVDLRRGDTPPPPPPRPAWPWFTGVVAVVVAVMAIYWGAVATPRYEAVAGFTIRGGTSAPSLGDLSSLMGGASSGDPNRHLLAFVPSASCFSVVDDQLGLRKLWSDGRIDWFSRLAPDADREQALAVWNSRVRIVLDDATGLLEVKAQGFTAADALATATAVMNASEALVNDLNRSQALAKSKALDEELERSRAAIDRAVADLLAFQDRHGLADVAAAVQAISGASLGVESELVQQRAALAETLSVMGEDADQVRRTRARIAALEREVALARARVADSATAAGPRLNQLAAEQIRLQGVVELRQEIHRQLMATAIQTQAESQHATMHLAVIAKPALPEAAAYPRFWYNLLTLAVISGILAAVAAALWSTIRERMD